MSKIVRKQAWQLFQINTTRTEGYTLFFDSYEKAKDAANILWEYEITKREWDDWDETKYLQLWLTKEEIERMKEIIERHGILTNKDIWTWDKLNKALKKAEDNETE